MLNENERLDDLGINNLKVIQNKKWFCFGIDSVLLSDFAKDMKSDSKVIDLGTGSGVIPIILTAKTKAKSFLGVEVQDCVCDMACRSVKMNNLENKIEILNSNVLDLKKGGFKNFFDVVITNPPYKKFNTGLTNNNIEKEVARHEVKASLEDFIEISSFVLKNLGEFYMVHRPDRLVDIMVLLRKYNIEPKKIKFVYPNKNKKANIVLIKGIKNAKPFLEFEKNLIVYNEDGSYTEDIIDIYNNK